jgi:hypothetical protein
MTSLTYKALFEEWLAIEQTKGLLDIKIFWAPHVLNPEYRKKESITITEEDVFREMVDLLTAPSRVVDPKLL